jgi:ABC-type Na+ efflux pump permease subunit
MLDDFRNEMDADAFLDELEEEEEEVVEVVPKKTPPSKMFGLTSMQRFILAIMLFLMICIAGSFCLLAFGKIALPF